MNEITAANWAILDEDGVVDRFTTEAEARAELSTYPVGCRVVESEDYNPLGDLRATVAAACQREQDAEVAS